MYVLCILLLLLLLIIIIIHPLPKVNERYRTLEGYNDFRLTVRPVGFYIAEVSHLLLGPLYKEQIKLKGRQWGWGWGSGSGVRGQGSGVGGLAVYTLLA